MDISNNDDLKVALDSLLEPKTNLWWDEFYNNATDKIPFLVDLPSENLKELLTNHAGAAGNALDIGCGNGRNARYLARKGYDTTAIDFSKTSIEMARSIEPELQIRYLVTSLEAFETQAKFDLIYDGGCLHHIAPHRRFDYLSKIASLLSPKGFYAFEVFNQHSGSGLTDMEVYEQKSMRGGLGYSEEKLLAILTNDFEVIQLRPMRDVKDQSAFGIDLLITGLCRRKP